MIRPEDIAESVRFLLQTSRACLVPEIVFLRPGDGPALVAPRPVASARARRGAPRRAARRAVPRPRRGGPCIRRAGGSGASTPSRGRSRSSRPRWRSPVSAWLALTAGGRRSGTARARRGSARQPRRASRWTRSASTPRRPLEEGAERADFAAGGAAGALGAGVGVPGAGEGGDGGAAAVSVRGEHRADAAGVGVDVGADDDPVRLDAAKHRLLGVRGQALRRPGAGR